MESFNFVIPLSIDALQQSSSTRQYVVTNISIARELPARLQEAQVLFRHEGPNFIIKESCFNAFYSVLVNYAAADVEVREKAWDLTVKAMARLTSDLQGVLEGELSTRERRQWLNMVKMTTYVACTLTEAQEKESNKPSNTIALTKKVRKKTVRVAGEEDCDWEEKRSRMLLQLYSILQHPLHRLWDPPVMEEDYVNLIANCCYKILESPTMGLVRTKSTRDSIFQIIGTLVKKFNHGLACSLKLMQLLQHFEHMVTPASQGTVLLIKSFGIKSVMTDMIIEQTKMEARELQKDTMGVRNFTQFLAEVAANCPEEVLPSLSLLINFLYEDAYPMRNCGLSILGSVVLKVLSGDDLDDKARELRDQCLDHLEDHIHDIHAFVRSKVLNIWKDLVAEKAVPLRRQQQVLRLVLGRLMDKTATVRKVAMQLLTAFLKGNPFSTTLPLEDLQSQFETELKKLQELVPGTKVDEAGELQLPQQQTDTAQSLWTSLLPKVVQAVERSVDQEDSDEEEEEEEAGQEERGMLNSAITEVAAALKANKISRAVKLVEAAIKKFRESEIFQYDPEEEASTAYEELAEEELSRRQVQVLVVMQRVFVSAWEMEKLKQQAESTDKDKETLEQEKKEARDIAKQKLLVTFLKDSVQFAKLVHKGLPVVCQLLRSKVVSDVLEAISFFVTAFEYGLLNAMTGVRQMLALVWSKEADVKEAVITAYQRLYIQVEAPNQRAQAQHIVRNLTSLVTGATVGERASLEEIVTQFVSSGDISKECVMLLWERFTKTLPDTTDDEATSALILLAMCANSEVSIISSNINVLLSSGLRESADSILVKETCSALLKMANTKPKTDAPTAPHRFEEDHEIFKRLSEVLLKGLTVMEDQHYCPMATEAVSAIYGLAEHPDVICGEIVKQMCHIMADISNKTAGDSEAGSSELREGELVRVPAGVLARFFVVVGHVALKQLLHLDIFIFTEIKRRNMLKEEMETEKQKKKKSKKNKRLSLITSATEASRIGSGLQDGDMDEEMELTGAVADDLEAEYIRSICDTEVMNKDNLLGAIKPMIWTVCTNPDKYQDPELRAAATLALAKFMMVSTEVCEENLQVLFTILEKSEEAVIRANTMVALGDLSFRFPNSLEPWTPRIYARLRDQDPMVRQNTLTMLTHLILNDMVKVKGQISDIALCINDQDPRIAGLANTFFTELSRKGNALYNVMPDIISRLSDTELGIEEDNFREIIGKIFSLIQKEKHQESLVEKLCHRFQATINMRQWRDIAYCLSLLQYNEKSVRKLSENFVCYADKLHEPEVYDFLQAILSSAQKNMKQESRLAIEELEKKMKESHDKGVEDESVANKAASAARHKTKKNQKNEKRKVRRRTAEVSSDEEESEDEDFRWPTPTKGARHKVQKRPTESSEEEREDEVFEGPPVQPGHTGKPRRSSRQSTEIQKKAATSSLSSEEEEEMEASEEEESVQKAQKTSQSKQNNTRGRRQSRRK